MNLTIAHYEEREALRATVSTLAKFVPLVESLLSLMAETPVGRSRHLIHRGAMQSVRSGLDELLAVAQVNPQICAALRRPC